MAGEFCTPQECRPIGEFQLWAAAVAIKGDRVPIRPACFFPIAGLDFAERQMPAQMTVEKAVARIGGEPRREKGAAVFGSPLS